MKKSDRQNALAVAAVALCFMLTLGLCYFLGGEGFLLAFNQSEGEVKCYLLCGGSYENVTLARNAAVVYGQVLSNEEMENIINALFVCSNFNYTPDGKKILSILKGTEIEHLFA